MSEGFLFLRKNKKNRYLTCFIRVRYLSLPSFNINHLKLKLDMFAIVEIAGQQFKVEKDQTLYVHRLPQEEGASIDLNNVLLVDNNGKVSVGAPSVSGATVKAKVLNHLKGDKVLVFKKKRRKGYRKMNGHRQYLTKIQIEAINA